jgi:hypothetical protein
MCNVTGMQFGIIYLDNLHTIYFQKEKKNNIKAEINEQKQTQ